MPDIFDYMAWRGDLDIRTDGFNEVDSLILSCFSYVPLDGIVASDFETGMSIGSAAQKFIQDEKFWKRLRMQNDGRLFEEIGQCPRFAHLPLHAHVNILSPGEERQFSAVSIGLGDGSLFVSYRGTDNTLVGWKEDFNMSFMREVPAQADAVAYLENMASHFDGPLRVGGHSKGGNLAVYASAFCSRAVQDRIIEVYNNDGPWLHTDRTKEPGYLAVRTRIRAFVPQTSIVGMLLEHEEDYTVVRSRQTGPFQHDFYSWEVFGPHFVTLAEVTGSSKFVKHTIRAWLAEWDEDQRALFVDALFQIIGSGGAETFQEMGDKWYLNAAAMLKSYKNLDKDMRKVIAKTLKLLMKAAGGQLSYITPAMPFLQGRWKQETPPK